MKQQPAFGLNRFFFSTTDYADFLSRNFPLGGWISYDERTKGALALGPSLIVDPRPAEDGEADVGDGFEGGDGA